MSKTLQGTRLNDNESPSNPGEYSKWSDGSWMLCLPTGIHGRINDKIWKITEHDDNTITVSPSIKTTCGDHKYDWHGFLEKGVWREC